MKNQHEDTLEIIDKQMKINEELKSNAFAINR